MNIKELFRSSKKRQVVVISPHPDDAAFSVGGLITRLKNQQLLLITAFSKSCRAERSDALLTSEARAKEDSAYTDHVHGHLIRLGLQDTSIRGNLGRESLTEPGERQIRLQLTTLLSSAVSRSENRAIFVPLAIGGHPDHIHCRQVAEGSLAEQPLIFYEDLPYSQFAGGPDNTRDWIRQEVPGLYEINIPLTSGQMKSKLHGLDLYRSQLHPKWRSDIEEYARSLGARPGQYGERYWAPEQLLPVIFSLLS